MGVQALSAKRQMQTATQVRAPDVGRKRTNMPETTRAINMHQLGWKTPPRAREIPYITEHRTAGKVGLAANANTLFFLNKMGLVLAKVEGLQSQPDQKEPIC